VRHPGHHASIYLYIPEGWRIPLNFAPNGLISLDGPVERSLEGTAGDAAFRPVKIITRERRQEIEMRR
jgi:hypothetical protein